MTTCKHTLQNCDGFFERKEALDLNQALELLRQTDWNAKHQETQARKAQAVSYCPYNVIFFQDKHFLRIMSDGQTFAIESSARWGFRKFLALIYPGGPFDTQIPDLDWEQISKIMEFFFANQQSELVRYIKPLDQGVQL